ncbi:ABC transporter substrate-binding protein [Chitinimonas sp. BJYL2]|uniref:substrate-binding periplasmic protein n=1 Tax=Chitinimonas sp. BJYL2 TaxID=2976696 RepID=UPI0022B56485|nr:transporter substrate-binding domain-containing protein [Chitinimonas sp. BJYL2]
MRHGLLLVAMLATPALADTVTIAAEDDWYPYCAKVGNEAKGMAVDIVREAFKAAGVNLKLEVMPYARCMAQAKAGQVAGCFDAARNSALEQDYVWHKPALFKAKISIYAQANSPQSDLGVKDLEGKDVAVTNGYEYGEAFDTNPRIKRSVNNQDVLGFRKLAAGRVQYAVAYEKVANSIFEKNKAEFAGKFKAVGMTAEPELYIAFTKANPDGAKFAARFSQGLETIMKNGKYKEIEAKWR